MKRVVSLLLSAVMLVSMVPAVYASNGEPAKWEGYFAAKEAFAEKAETVLVSQKAEKKLLTPAVPEEAYGPADDLFDKIDALEAAHAKKNASETQLADAAAKLVTESESYVPDSLERKGNTFTWWTAEGIRCVYSPRMRQLTQAMTPTETARDFIVNEPMATKGGPGNNQVYLVGPYYGYDEAFSDQYKNEAKAIAAAIGDTDGYTLYSGKAATVDKVAEAVSNGAVVIFDSHGGTDYEFGEDYVTGAENSYLCLTSTTGLTAADYSDGALYDRDGIWINGATIANHMTKKSPGGMLWMAICLGMATDTICQPMREQGVEVVYGYSQSVFFNGDYLFEETFWDNMCAGKNVADSIAVMKQKWGNWDWSVEIAEYYGCNDGYATISEARRNYAAFPVVVSDEDTYPGQRSRYNYGSCSLQTVCSTYSLADYISAPPQEEEPVKDYYDQLVAYINAYGSELDDGSMCWLEMEETEDYTFYFTLQNVEEGILFECLMVGNGYSSMDLITSFVLEKSSHNLDVAMTMLLYEYDEAIDYVEAVKTIDRRTFTTSSEYTLYESGEYIDSEYTTTFFNLSLQLLCQYWDGEIYANLGFGLRNLGFTFYDGYYTECSHSFDNACDEICNLCGAIRDISHTFGAFFMQDEDYHRHSCTVCGFQETQPHIWDEGVVIKAPTETEAGEMRYTCWICSGQKVVELRPIGAIEPGDTNGDGIIDNGDVAHLLWYTLFPEDYPVCGDVDFDRNGIINNKDVEYLLWHTLFPEDYPL